MVVVVPEGGNAYGYDQLLSDATEILGRDPFTAAYRMAISEINKRLRVRQMLQEELGGIDLPSDFLEAETVKVESRVFTPTGGPLVTDGTFVIHNGTLSTCPEHTENIFLRYYEGVQVLTGNETDAVMTAYPEIFLFGLLAMHATLARDADGSANWGPRFFEAIEVANKADIMARQSALPISPKPAMVV